jgi:hypothetical protein
MPGRRPAETIVRIYQAFLRKRAWRQGDLARELKREHWSHLVINHVPQCLADDMNFLPSAPEDNDSWRTAPRCHGVSTQIGDPAYCLPDRDGLATRVVPWLAQQDQRAQFQLAQMFDRGDIGLCAAVISQLHPSCRYHTQDCGPLQDSISSAKHRSLGSGIRRTSTSCEVPPHANGNYTQAAPTSRLRSLRPGTSCTATSLWVFSRGVATTSRAHTNHSCADHRRLPIRCRRFRFFENHPQCACLLMRSQPNQHKGG